MIGTIELKGVAQLPQRFFSFAEAVEYTGVSEGTLRHHVYVKHKIPYYLIGKTAVFSREQLDDYMENGETDITINSRVWMGTIDAAAYLGMTEGALKQHVHTRRNIPALKIGHSLLFNRAELDEFLAERGLKPPAR